MNLKRNKSSCVILTIVAFSFLCILATIAILFGVGVFEYSNAPRLVSGFSFAAQPDAGYQLSVIQQDYIDENGYPASFSILFYQQEDINGEIQDIRYETWYYLGNDIQVTFFNGVVSQTEVSPLEGGTAAWKYKPEMFDAYMSRAQVAQSAHIQEWLIIPVENALVRDAEVYYADGLAFGFQNDELVFVEVFTGKQGD